MSDLEAKADKLVEDLRSIFNLLRILEDELAPLRPIICAERYGTRLGKFPSDYISHVLSDVLKLDKILAGKIFDAFLTAHQLNLDIVGEGNDE